MRNPHIVHTHPFLHFFELSKNFGDYIWLGYSLNRFIHLEGGQMISKSKNTKILERVRKMSGILTFFVPSHFFPSSNFLKLLGTSYGLDIVSISSLHLGGNQMISEKSKSKNTKKIRKATKNVRNPFVTFFVPTHFFASLNFLKNRGTSYGLDIV